MDEYVREFVQESEENITELNNALLALERDPDDDEAMERIFRTAHTLKGNCGAMGFTDASDLAHALEDLLDAVRSGALDVSPELMDRIFEGVDLLEAMIDDVPQHGEPRTDPTSVIETLREQLAATEGLTEPSDREIDSLLEDADDPAEVSHNLFHARLDVSEERESQGMLVVEALEDAFDLLGTAPDPDEIEAGDYGGSFDAVFASAVEERSISAALDPVEAVEGAIVAEVTDRVGGDDAADDAGDDSPAGSDADEEIDPDDMEVDDLLDEFSEYDDLDEMVEQVDDVEGFEDLGDAGTFDDIEIGDVGGPSDDVDETEPAEADAEDGDGDDSDDAADETGDASDTFQELKQEVDPVGFDELQDELEELEFEELDDDEVGFDELLEEDELGGDDPFASGEVSADPFGAGDADEPSVGELIGEDGLDDESAADEDEDADELDETDDLLGDDAADADPTTADADVDADDATAVADADDATAAETDDATANTDDGIADALDEAFEDGVATDAPASTEDDVSASDDGADVEPALDLDDPFGDSGADGQSSSDSASPEESADDGGGIEISDAGQFEDIDFTDPDEPPEDEQFGTADELDLSMGITDDGESDDEPEDDAGVADDAEVETTTFDADATDSATASESSIAGDADVTATDVTDTDSGTDEVATDATAAEADTAGESVEADASGADDSAADTAVESAEADADERGVPGRTTQAGSDAAAASAPSAAAGTGVDAEAIQSIRVDVDQVDDLMNLVEELVTTRARLRRAVEGDEPRSVIEGEVDELEVITSELQDTVMDVRLVPLQTVANKLPRLVRDISREQDKRVALEMDGEDVELDRSILDQIGDPLMHLVRNAIDHGIESPEEREDVGKDPEGTIELRARRERDEVVIEIDDDGRGLDVDAIRDEAAEQGIAEYHELLEMDDEDVYDLVFHAGFSTSDEVTDVSGRGVGMDVVASTVEELDGSVSVDSEAGEGTTVRLRVPISVAIADVLFVESGGEEYGIPIKVVEEIGPSGAVTSEDGREVVDRGEESYPLIRLSDALETPRPGRNGDGMMVKVRDDVRPVALHCDRIRGQQEVVVKPFEGFLGNIPGISGATVLGEGDVVNILDVETL